MEQERVHHHPSTDRSGVSQGKLRRVDGRERGAHNSIPTSREESGVPHLCFLRLRLRDALAMLRRFFRFA